MTFGFEKTSKEVSNNVCKLVLPPNPSETSTTYSSSEYDNLAKQQSPNLKGFSDKGDCQAYLGFVLIREN